MPSSFCVCRRTGQFSWRVDLAAVRQLYDDASAAGSRDSRILRSPAHSFAGYEVRGVSLHSAGFFCIPQLCRWEGVSLHSAQLCRVSVERGCLLHSLVLRQCMCS
jgi:hypothetical protein